MNRDRDKRIKEKSPIELFTYLSLYFKKEIKNDCRISKICVDISLNGYVIAPIYVEACNNVFKNKHVDERTEIVTRGTVAVGGILTSAIVADAVVDLVVKKSTEEAVKGFIRALV